MTDRVGPVAAGRRDEVLDDDRARERRHERVLAPVRVWGLTRADCVELAAKWEIPIEATVEKLYSIDENMWGRAIECGVLENPWTSPPEEPFTLTRTPRTRPRARDIVVGFERAFR